MYSFAYGFRSSLLCKLALAFVVVFVGDWLFFRQQLSGGYGSVFALSLLAALLAGRKGVRRDRRALVAVAAGLLFVMALAFDAGRLSWTLFWLSTGMAALLPATGRFDDGWRWFQRLVYQNVAIPVAPFTDLRRALKIGGLRRQSAFSLRRTLPVLMLPIVGSVVILGLFAAANPIMERLLSTLLAFDLSALSPARIVLWGAMFALAWGVLRPRLAPALLPTFDGRGDLALPGVSVVSVTLSLIVFNLLFLFQNMLDIAYLGGFVSMPPGMTLADYAHRGAYPLIATALLAALFVLVTLRPGSMTASVVTIRRLVMLWIVQNLCLVASSVIRTLDYIEAYSLTELRIAALVWMALVGVGLLTICWRLLRDRSAGWLINVNMGAVALLLTVAGFVDIGAVAAQWNTRHAREAGGKGAGLDLCYLHSLGDSALLPLLAFEQRPDLDPGLKGQVKWVRQDLYRALAQDINGGGWSLRGQMRLNAATRMIVDIGPSLLPLGPRPCEGNPMERTRPIRAWPTSDAAPTDELGALTAETGK